MADESLSSQVAQAPHLKDPRRSPRASQSTKAKKVTGVKAAGRAYGKAADDAFRAGAGMFENPIRPRCSVAISSRPISITNPIGLSEEVD